MPCWLLEATGSDNVAMIWLLLQPCLNVDDEEEDVAPQQCGGRHSQHFYRSLHASLHALHVAIDRCWLLAACSPMCWCVGNQSPNKMFAGTALQQLCNTKCAQCVAEASQCVSPSDPLPGTCKEGLQFNEMVKELVDKCFNMYTTDPSSVSTAVGC